MSKLLDLMVGTLHYLMIPMGEAQMLKLFDFHTKLTLRFLEASSQDMQLWAWNQMGAIIALTQRHCWSPKAVMVRVLSTGNEMQGFEKATTFVRTGICINT